MRQRWLSVHSTKEHCVLGLLWGKVLQEGTSEHKQNLSALFLSVSLCLMPALPRMNIGNPSSGPRPSSKHTDYPPDRISLWVLSQFADRLLVRSKSGQRKASLVLINTVSMSEPAPDGIFTDFDLFYWPKILKISPKPWVEKLDLKICVAFLLKWRNL